MSFGIFRDEGRRYEIQTPDTPSRWFNYLFNDSYYLEVAQNGAGASIAMQPSIRTINGEGYRHFYLSDHDTGRIWCPAGYPLEGGADDFSCAHSLGWSEIRSHKEGIQTVIRIFVPREGMREIWSVTVTNESGEPRRLSLFSAFAMENGGVMGSHCRLDEEAEALTSFAFPYHVFYEDKQKADIHSNLIYLLADRRAESYSCGERNFFGRDDTRKLPAAVAAAACDNTEAEGEKPIGAYQHVMELQPGGTFSISFVFGCARTSGEVRAIREEFLARGAEELLREVEAYWEGLADPYTVDTPDADLNHFMNYWLKKQIVMQTRTNRLTNYCPVRNQLQDAMGYAMLDPAGALGYMESVLRRQRTSGFIQQWIMTDGSAPQKLCLLTHKDGPVWLLICLIALVHQTGDPGVLDRQVGFEDSVETATIYEHLLRAAAYMSEDTGAHGLCLMGHGDWNDPINGPGRLGRGESAWSTMALKFAVLQLLPLCRLRGDLEKTEGLMALAARLDQAINDTCWDGEWYIAGFDDEGEAFGTARDEEGRLFLNTQTWAIMCGAAREERLRLCLEAVDRLETPAGPLLLDPAFSGWNPKWGRISVKLAGTTENGSVYCHASMFKAFADCLAGRGGAAYRTVARTLPTSPENPPEINRQVPIFLPNYYFGLRQSPNFGRSSHHNSTGTVGWMMWTVLEYILGIRATAEGLEIDPCIPPEWEEYAVTRRFRDAHYKIRVLNPRHLNKGRVRLTVNGSPLEGARLPYEAGQIYEVTAEIG